MTNASPRFTFGSLFSGVGGIDLGLERAGLEGAWQVEIDERCRELLAKRFPDVLPDGYTEGFSDSTRYRMLGNAVAVPCAIPLADESVDLICCSPPSDAYFHPLEPTT